MGSDDPAERARALDGVVRAYWKPVYKHVRLKWKRVEDDARDLTQALFARALEKGHFAGYDPALGRFRTYLKTCLDRFVMESTRDAQRQKRGGGLTRLSLDFELAEDELRRAGPSQQADIEACFDAEWTRNLFETAVASLETECAKQSKQRYFAAFQRYVLDREHGDPAPTYAALGSELGLSVSDVTNYLAWARREFKRILLTELRDITTSDEEWKSEARALLGSDP